MNLPVEIIHGKIYVSGTLFQLSFPSFLFELLWMVLDIDEMNSLNSFSTFFSVQFIHSIRFFWPLVGVQIKFI